ncbi:tyrosine--tRNA ligase [PVC group bacterium (ex Bugula neritina AB1)]|nr:tyrosine--tRNA ligase [PVC group bacterium (ex Bugula neritina AB1)]
MTLTEEMDIFKRGCSEIISEKELKDKLVFSREKSIPLKIKAGFDPSAPDIHLGHTVLLRKLRHMQECGHQIFFLIGDFTGRIGDPTGKSVLRKRLTEEEVVANARTYQEQVFKILDKDKTIVVFNSSWYSKMSFEKVLELSSHYTVARMLERNDFSKRFESNKPISVLEFMYPLMQGYDSVELESDIEIGGVDQKFNLLMGRHLQKEYGKESQQVVMMMPLLEGLDGTQKMSKSLGNYVAINDTPDQMFGKLMSISDELMFSYYELLTDFSLESLKDLKKEMLQGDTHPKDLKIQLAKSIIKGYHGLDSAEKAAKNFQKIFQNNKLPDNIEEYKASSASIWIVQILLDSGLCSSKGEARRMIRQGAVKCDQKKITDEEYELTIGEGVVLQVGKRAFRKILF